MMPAGRQRGRRARSPRRRCMTVVEPCSNGLGSDAFCILWDGKKLHGLNASGPAPAAWTPEYFRSKHGADAARRRCAAGTRSRCPVRSAGWVALSRALRQAAVRRPARAGDRDRRARLRGAGRRPAEVGRRRRRCSARSPAGPRLPAARPRARGRRALRVPGRGARAEGDRRDAGAAFYGGEIAAGGGGAFARQRRRDDGERLRRVQAGVGRADRAWTTDGHACTRFRPTGRASPRWSRWASCDHFDIASLPVDGAESQHLQIEAMKLAFADVYALRRRPARMAVHDRGDARRRLPRRARAPDRPEARAGLRRRQPGRAAARSTSAPPTRAA